MVTRSPDPTGNPVDILLILGNLLAVKLLRGAVNTESVELNDGCVVLLDRTDQ